MEEVENRFDTKVENPQMIFLFWKWKIISTIFPFFLKSATGFRNFTSSKENENNKNPKQCWKRRLKSVTSLGLRSETFSLCAPNRCHFYFVSVLELALSQERSAIFLSLRSLSHLRASPNILRSRAHYFLWTVRHVFVLRSSFYLKNVPPNVLRSGAHFISGALRQTFCAPGRWKGVSICWIGCLVVIVSPLLIEKKRLRIAFQNMCDVCEKHVFSEKMEMCNDSRTKWKIEWSSSHKWRR